MQKETWYIFAFRMNGDMYLKKKEKKKKYGATVIILRFCDAAILLTMTFWNEHEANKKYN